MRLGIDLGTCFSSIAIYCDINNYLTSLKKYDGISKNCLWDKHGNIPTVFYNSPFNSDSNKELIGQCALEAYEQPGWSKYGIKDIKKKLVEDLPDDDFKQIIHEQRLRGYDITRPYHHVKQEYDTKEIIILILLRLIEEAKKESSKPPLSQRIRNKKIENIVITVPAKAKAKTYRSFIKNCVYEACKRSGDPLDENKIHLLDEPVSSALYYFREYNKNLARKQCILIYDLGGGTFDTAIVEYDPTINEKFKVLGAKNELEPLMQEGCLIGGNDWNDALKRNILANVKNQKIIISERDDVKFNKAVIDAKILLSTEDEVNFFQNAFNDYFDGFLEYSINNELEEIIIKDDVLIRKDFEEIEKIKELMKQTISTVDKLLANFEIYCKKNNVPFLINQIVLSGGASQMPMVRNCLEDKYGSYIPIFPTVLGNDAIALGAAIYAGAMDRINLLSPYAYGVGIYDESIKANKPIRIKTLIKKNLKIDNSGIESDELPGTNRVPEAVYLTVFEIDTNEDEIIYDDDMNIHSKFRVPLPEAVTEDSIVYNENMNMRSEFRIMLPETFKKRSLIVKYKLLKGGILQVYLYEKKLSGLIPIDGYCPKEISVSTWSP